MPVKDEIGKTFGSWLVLARAKSRRGEDNRLHAYLLCRCVCGKEVEVLTRNLRKGRSRSCGCGALSRSLEQLYRINSRRRAS